MCVYIYRYTYIYIHTHTQNKEDIILRDDGKTRHKYKLKKIRGLKDVKKHSFPNRSLEIWNSLEEEVVGARNIHTFKSKLDEGRYRDRTTRALLNPCTLQVGKYN